MGFTKDLWTRPENAADGEVRSVRNERWGKGKRWLACWIDPDGNDKSKVFRTQKAADRHWQAKETDKERGEYVDAKAGEVLFKELGKRWLDSRIVDPSSKIQYESKYRLHVEPTFGKRKVGRIKPSEIQHWLGDLSERFDVSTVLASFLVLQGVLELAVADGAIKPNPARSKAVHVPKRAPKEIRAWSDERVFAMIDAHPERYRLVPILGAACGLREGEIFGLAEEDLDFDEKVIRVRRQLKKVNSTFVFALPKNDRERVVPLPDWAAEAFRMHVEAYPSSRTRFPGRSPAASRTPASCCCGGIPTTCTSGHATSANASGSRRLSRPR